MHWSSCWQFNYSWLRRKQFQISNKCFPGRTPRQSQEEPVHCLCLRPCQCIFLLLAIVFKMQLWPALDLNYKHWIIKSALLHWAVHSLVCLLSSRIIFLFLALAFKIQLQPQLELNHQPQDSKPFLFMGGFWKWKCNSGGVSGCGKASNSSLNSRSVLLLFTSHEPCFSASLQA